MIDTPLADSREAAHAAYLDATTRGLDPAARLDEALDALFDTLAGHGLDLTPYAAPTQDTLEEYAQLLARSSDFPRYTAEGGWSRVMESAADVEVAYRKAAERLRPGQEATVMDLAMARQRLLDHLRTKNVIES